MADKSRSVLGLADAAGVFVSRGGWWRWVLLNAAVVGGLLVTALLSNRIADTFGGSVQIWLPAGLALAMICMLGARALPGIVAGVVATPFLVPPVFITFPSPPLNAGLGAYVAQQLMQVLATLFFLRPESRVQPAVGGLALAQRALFAQITVVPAAGALTAILLAGGFSGSFGTLSGTLSCWMNLFLGNALGIAFIVPMVLIPPEKTVPERASARGRFLGVCVLGFLCTASALKIVAVLEERQLRASFDKNASIVIKGVKDSLEKSIMASQMLGDEIWLADGLSAKRFEDIAAAVHERYPAVRAMTWVPEVPQSELGRFVQARRAEGASAYDVFEMVEGGTMVSVRPRPIYYPVSYIFPQTGPNLFALGYDLNSEALRRDVIARALTSGATEISSPVQQVGTRVDVWAILAVTPVCRKVPRKSHCQADGFAVAVLGLADVWSDLRQQYLHLPVTWSAADLDGPGSDRLTYRSGAGEGRPAYNLATESTQVFGGHRWKISVQARPSPESLTPDDVSEITALGLLGLWLITLAYLLSEREKREAVAQLMVRVGQDSEKFQAEWKRSKDLLAEAVDAISEGFTIYDPDDRLVTCNEAYKRIYALSAAYIVPGASFEEIIRQGAQLGQYGESARRDVELWVRHRLAQHRLADGTPFEQYLGDGRWLIISERKTRDGYTVGNRIDISHLKRLQQSISKQNDTLMAIMEMSPDGFVGVTNDGRVSFANRGFEVLTGIEAQTIVNETVSLADKLLASHLPASQGVWSLAESFSQALHGGGSSSSVYRVETPLGSTLQINWIVAESTSAGYLAHFRDISRETETDRMKTDFLAHAAHELRTPMANVFGFAELLMTNDFDAEVSRDIAQTIHRQAGRLNQIINEVLDLSRIDSGAGLVMAPTRFDLKALVQDVVAEQATLATRIPAGALDAMPSVTVFADKTRSAQCLVNVLSNALKFSPAEEPVEVGIGLGSRMGFVSVRDHGIGIRPENHGKIGRRFWRENASGNVPGTGLGLAIVKELMARQHGLVTFVSPDGGGTEVILCLPLQSASDGAPTGCECSRYRLEGMGRGCQRK